MLSVEAIQAGYGTGADVLHGISLEVRSGEVVALIGANGAGKSTTLRAISGLIPVRSGAVRLRGLPVHGRSPSAIARLGLAHAPEGRRVFAPLTVEDNLLVGAWRRLPAFIGYRARAAHALERVYGLFPRLGERRSQPAGSLSGGEQQMLAIGRALMAEPDIVLLDEPSMGLAPVMAQEVFRILSRLKAGGITLLLVEQFAASALALADRAYVLERGRVVAAGEAAALREDPAVRAAYLG